MVRKLDAGHTRNYDNQDVGYIVMENLPGCVDLFFDLFRFLGNPVGILGYLTGKQLQQKVCDFGLQLLKAVYDLHFLGLVHRDIKPENVGLYKDKLLVLYGEWLELTLIFV
jgi:serine/threonine protein kinase